MRVSSYAVPGPSLRVGAGEYRILLWSSRTCRLLSLDTRTWAAVERGDLTSLSEGAVATLREAAILVPDTEDELAAVLDANAAAIRDARSLYVVLASAAGCNFACRAYCGQTHRPGSMDARQGDLVLERIERKLRTHARSELLVGWFGGEPLTGLAFIREFTPRAIALAASHGASFDAKIVTNGYLLTPATACELVRDLRVSRIEVTLDGPRGAHDARRPTLGGGGSFDRVLENVCRLAEREDVRPVIVLRTNVDRENADRVLELLDTLAGRGLPGRGVRWYPAPVHAWGNNADLRSLPPTEYAQREIDWLVHAAALGFAIQPLPARREAPCLTLDPSAEVIDADGVVYNCTESTYVVSDRADPAQPSTSVYAIGTLEHGTDEARRERLGGFFDQVRAGTWPCRNCRMLPTCGGACPKSWHEGHVPCPSPKLNIEQRMLLAHALHRAKEKENA